MITRDECLHTWNCDFLNSQEAVGLHHMASTHLLNMRDASKPCGVNVVN